MKLIQEEMKRVIGYVQAELKFDNITFAYSTVTEFIQDLTATRSANDKYPFFYVDSVGVTYEPNGIDTICTVKTIVIATDSKPKWTALKRDEESVKPILLPIYDLFVDKLNRDRNIELFEEGDLIIHYFYGDTGLSGYDSGKFPDHVDAIQLNNYKFSLTNNCKTK